MTKLEDFKQKEKELVKKLEKKRLLIGKADSAMESAHPSGRFELENYIELLETQLRGVRQEINKLEK